MIVVPKISMRKLAKACSLGNQGACNRLALTIMAASELTFATADYKDHPNAMPFRGVLLVLNQPSTKPPHGSNGHKINVSTEAARKNLGGLIGMGINYDPGDLNEHMPRHKVGVITGAWISGDKVWVKGIIYAKDFPEAKKSLKGRSDLGMSMELANVLVEEEHAPVWNLIDFNFTGATILKKDAAAYFQTSLAARAAATGEGEAMADKKKKKKVQVAAAGASGGMVVSEEVLAAAITRASRAGNREVIERLDAQGTQLNSLARRIDELETLSIDAAAEVEDEDPIEVEAGAEDEGDDIEAGADEDEDDDDIEAAGDDSDDDDDDEGDDEDPSDVEALADLGKKAPHSKPGEINHGMKTKGSKTTTTDVGAEGEKGGLVRASSIHAAAKTIRAQAQTLRKVQKQLRILAEARKADKKKFRAEMKRMEATLEAAADSTDRRSAQLPADLTNLFAKSNVDLREIKASGAKLSVQDVDLVINASGLELEPVQKIAMKNRLQELGLMDDGKVERNYVV